jgi:hypothetical protein
MAGTARATVMSMAVSSPMMPTHPAAAARPTGRYWLPNAAVASRQMTLITATPSKRRATTGTGQPASAVCGVHDAEEGAVWGGDQQVSDVVLVHPLAGKVNGNFPDAGTGDVAAVPGVTGAAGQLGRAALPVST